MTHEQRVDLWDAINEVVTASGGSDSCTSVARQLAVVKVENVISGIENKARFVSDRAIKAEESRLRARADRDPDDRDVPWECRKCGSEETRRLEDLLPFRAWCPACGSFYDDDEWQPSQDHFRRLMEDGEAEPIL